MSFIGESALERPGSGTASRWSATRAAPRPNKVLIGGDDGAHNFALRYFTIPPGGFSSLDHHAHDHGVMVMNGRARVMLGEDFAEVGPGDVIYIAGWERHQFENISDEPFTFLCVVPGRTHRSAEAQAVPAAHDQGQASL